MADKPAGKPVAPARSFNASGRNDSAMSNAFRSSVLVVLAALACGLSGCGTINEKLTAGMADTIPQWAGGLPPDAPPRPGTLQYDEFMRERERKRLEPKVDQPGQPAVAPAALGAVH